jgi:hypothetical protein
MPVYPGALRFARHPGSTFSEATYGHSLCQAAKGSNTFKTRHQPTSAAARVIPNLRVEHFSSATVLL